MKYKSIKSVAHNFAHSFVYATKHVAGDYVIGHLARAATDAREPELRMDLLTGDAEPAVLLTPPVRSALGSYVPWFDGLLRRHGVLADAVRGAAMRLRFDLSALDGPEPPRGFMLPYECVVEVMDDRGKLHVGSVRDEWPVEPRGSAAVRLP